MTPIINTNCSVSISQVDEVAIWFVGCDKPFHRIIMKSELEKTKKEYAEQGYLHYFLTTKAPDYYELDDQHIFCLE